MILILLLESRQTFRMPRNALKPRIPAPKLPVLVGQSEVGFAVYARRRLSRHAHVGRIRGTIIDNPDYSSDYCMDLGGSLSLEPAYPFRYLNHSCEPNCEIVQWEMGQGRSELWLHTIRAVQIGEELTIDYSWPADSAIRCLCGTNSCRGWIVDPDELSILQSAM